MASFLSCSIDPLHMTVTIKIAKGQNRDNPAISAMQGGNFLRVETHFGLIRLRLCLFHFSYVTDLPVMSQEACQETYGITINDSVFCINSAGGVGVCSVSDGTLSQNSG